MSFSTFILLFFWQSSNKDNEENQTQTKQIESKQADQDRLIEASLEAMEKELSVDSFDDQIQKIMEMGDSYDSNENIGSSMEVISSAPDNSFENEANIFKNKSFANRTECPENQLQIFQNDGENSTKTALSSKGDSEIVTNAKESVLPIKVEVHEIVNVNTIYDSNEMNEPFHYSTKTIDDWQSPRILHICNDSDFAIEPVSTENDDKNSIERTEEEKVRPIIEVLPECDSPDLSELIDCNSLVEELERSEIVDQNSVPDESNGGCKPLEPTPNPIEIISTSDDNVDHSNSSKQSQQMKPMKSNAITFFCENLDELKQIDSDSDESLEEI